MVVQFLYGYRRAGRRGICGHNRGEAAIAIRVWRGEGQSTRGGGGSFGVGLRGMQDLPNLDLPLPLLQDPSRLICAFKLAGNALLTFQTPHAPLAIDAPQENFPMALPAGAWNATACSHGPFPGSQGVQGQGAHRHSYHPMRNQNQNQTWSMTVLGSSWRLSCAASLRLHSTHVRCFNAGYNSASHTTKLKGREPTNFPE